MRPKRPRSWWQTIVADFETSGLTVTRFAALHDLHPESLRHWRSKLARELPAAGGMALVRVELAEVAPLAPQVLTAVVGPAELRVIIGTDPSYVGAVVAAIARAAQPC